MKEQEKKLAAIDPISRTLKSPGLSVAADQMSFTGKQRKLKRADNYLIFNMNTHDM